MQRIALIADIHGNLVALDAVLDEIDQEGIERVMCLGDAAGRGPHPREVLERLRERSVPTLLGNADELLIRYHDGTLRPNLANFIEMIDAWCAQRLAGGDIAFLSSLPFSTCVPLAAGVEIRCFHASSRSHSENVLPTSPISMLDALFGATSEALIAVGHTHEAMVRRYRGRTIINPGSVGAPFADRDSGDDRFRIMPYAEYAVVSLRSGGIAAELRRVKLDLEEVFRDARDSGMPHSDAWIAARTC